MYRVHPVTSDAAAVFSALDGAPDVSEIIAEDWESGAGRPEWCFVLYDGDQAVGRAGLFVEPTCPPELLGDLPPTELHLFGLWLPWERPNWLEAGVTLMSGIANAVAGTVPPVLQRRVNTALDDHAYRLRILFKSAGLSLFQEKHGYLWQDGGTPVPVPDRLTYKTLAEVGRDRYRSVLGRVGAGSLDRNDRWYYRLAGEQNWAAVFMSFAADGDADMWLLAEDASGDAVGFVGMSDFSWQPDMATVAFVGVVPEHRGNHYVDDLLLAGTAAAQQRGFTSVLSDVDVENEPMRAAMERCGHRGDGHDWHVWDYRGKLTSIAALGG